jgi:hypothetical protein
MKYKQVLPVQRIYFGDVTHEVKVNRIGNVYHCQVYTNGLLNQEAIAENQSEIGYVCKSLLRWEDKCGNISAFANAARERLNKEIDLRIKDKNVPVEEVAQGAS